MYSTYYVHSTHWMHLQYVEMYCVCVLYMYVCMYTHVHTCIHTPFTEHTVLYKLHGQLEIFFKGGKDMSQGIRGRGMEANLCVCMCVST